MVRLLMLPQPGASRALVSMTPGSIFSMPAKSRPLSAMSSMLSRVMSPERAPLVVCTSVASLTTLTVSSRPPTSSAMARSATRSVGASDDAFLLVGLEALDA